MRMWVSYHLFHNVPKAKLKLCCIRALERETMLAKMFRYWAACLKHKLTYGYWQKLQHIHFLSCIHLVIISYNVNNVTWRFSQYTDCAALYERHKLSVKWNLDLRNRENYVYLMFRNFLWELTNWRIVLNNDTIQQNMKSLLLQGRTAVIRMPNIISKFSVVILFIIIITSF